MNIFFYIIICSLLFEFGLRTVSKYLDLKYISSNLPDSFKNYYDENQYKKSQDYLKENTQFSYLTSTFDIILIIIVIIGGLFNNLDLLIRSWELSPLVNGLLFFGILFFIQDVINIPFSLYCIFIIEEKYGFNKLNLKTFFIDKVKGYFLLTIIGGGVLLLILFFFEKFNNWAWLYAWLGLSVFMVILQPLYTLFIAPMFNKFTPLEDGALKESINALSEKIMFPISNIDVMDGSKRSTKSNAYFSGIGKTKRIALFDTLIEQHTTNELLSILAHEVGHYKLKHNIKGVVLAIFQTGVMFYLLSLFLNNNSLFTVFKMDNLSTYASLLFFSILYSPVSFFLSIISNYISRKHEFEADAFAKKTIGTEKYLIEGLKKLTVSSLGNLYPHKLTILLNYSHPPVLQRIEALNQK
jgi:STE24 endopeptidase